MKQILRKVIDKQGEICIEELPRPLCGPDQVLVSTRYTLISSGTELATLKKTPGELVKQTIEDPWMRNAVKSTIASGGIKNTLDRVFDELYLYRVLGYSGSGIALEVGSNVTHIRPGDHVAFAAQGHAEIVAPYKNHVVKIPDDMDLKHAAFVTVGGIALQGIRRARVSLGEYVAVIGLGLVGQLTAQLLLAAGVQVIGIDIDPKCLEIAGQLGVKHLVNAKEYDPVEKVISITEGQGADVTMISAASSQKLIANQAMQMTRKQGRVVFVGIVKMHLERKPFFLNELDLCFSRAYGPGSYDNAYEKGRVSYPYEYIRWDIARNLKEFIRLIAEKNINIEPLISEVCPFEQAQTIFEKIKNNELRSIAAVLSYNPSQEAERKTVIHRQPGGRKDGDTVSVGIIGVGNHTRGVMLPLLQAIKGYRMAALCSASGTTAASVAKKYDVDFITSDYKEILNDKNIDMVFIATRHNLHARIAIDAAKAGKHILVEKPMAMSFDELSRVSAAVKEAGVVFAVGHNRRYSKAIAALKKEISDSPLIMRYTVSIKHLPSTHWTLDPVEGGGRLLGESDHFFDLFNYFAAAKPVDVRGHCIRYEAQTVESQFNFMVQIQYENQSMANLIYTSRAHASLPRERMEIFANGKVLSTADFKTYEIISDHSQAKTIGSPDMGHKKELEEFLKAVQGKPSEIAGLQDGCQATWIALKALERLT